MEMEASLSTVTYESGILDYDDFPHSLTPVYILGKVYSALHDRDELKADVISRIWITYRKGFSNIGGVGPSTDHGWGCMLRCGQMMLAQTLVLRHLGRDWRWRPNALDDDDYRHLLGMFEDKRSSVYSIHQIAMMGESEGKAIGQWFGPNTIAQVLKRISSYDSWSNVAIHVSLDNVVVKDDVYKLCRQTKLPTHEPKSDKQLDLLLDQAEFSKFVNDPKDESQSGGESGESEESTQWKPLLLIIPLRLGLTDINPIYFSALKKCLTLHQSVGFIGGKPNHAHFFIGYLDDELIYLDPHTTQPVVDLNDQSNTDHSYHCQTPPSRMSFHKLDPSIALGFYCASEEDFDRLCEAFTIEGGQTMFEVRNTWPQSWLMTDSDKTPAASSRSNRISLSDLNAEASSDEEDEFEIIEVM